MFYLPHARHDNPFQKKNIFIHICFHLRQMRPRLIRHHNHLNNVNINFRLGVNNQQNNLVITYANDTTDRSCITFGLVLVCVLNVHNSTNIAEESLKASRKYVMQFQHQSASSIISFCSIFGILNELISHWKVLKELFTTREGLITFWVVTSKRKPELSKLNKINPCQRNYSTSCSRSFNHEFSLSSTVQLLWKLHVLLHLKYRL